MVSFTHRVWTQIALTLLAVAVPLSMNPQVSTVWRVTSMTKMQEEEGKRRHLNT